MVSVMHGCSLKNARERITGRAMGKPLRSPASKRSPVLPPPQNGGRTLAGGLEAARFVVTGHSRGGHGAWLVGVTDRVTGVIGAAGWLKREEYWDANIAFRHDTSLSHLDPGMEASLKGTNLENDVELYAPHLTGMKVLGRVRSVDQSVPPI